MGATSSPPPSPGTHPPGWAQLPHAGRGARSPLEAHAPPSCCPGSAPAGPAHRTAWPVPPRRSCQSLTQSRLRSRPGGAGARVDREGGWRPGLAPARPRPWRPRTHHASSIVGGDGTLEAVGAVDDDQAALGCRPQLLKQVGLGGPIPRAEGLHDHALHGGLQEGPDLGGAGGRGSGTRFHQTWGLTGWPPDSGDCHLAPHHILPERPPSLSER